MIWPLKQTGFSYLLLPWPWILMFMFLTRDTQKCNRQLAEFSTFVSTWISFTERLWFKMIPVSEQDMPTASSLRTAFGTNVVNELLYEDSVFSVIRFPRPVCVFLNHPEHRRHYHLAVPFNPIGVGCFICKYAIRCGCEDRRRYAQELFREWLHLIGEFQDDGFDRFIRKVIRSFSWRSIRTWKLSESSCESSSEDSSEESSERSSMVSSWVLSRCSLAACDVWS